MLCITLVNGYKKIIQNDNLTFIFTHEKIYVQDRLQTFYLEPQEPYWKRRMLFIGTLMELGEVTDLDSLARYCGSKIRWVTTESIKDCVYVVKQAGNNDELRYSLRSLVNLPHRKVIIVGHKPDWCHNVIHIPINRYEYKWAKQTIRYHNAEIKWLAACSDPRVSESFYAMNDDFFVLRRAKGLPYYAKGLIGAAQDNRPGTSQHVKAVSDTGQFIRSLGFSEPLDFELHLPMVMQKAKRLEVNRLMQPGMARGIALLPRSIYGNLYQLPVSIRPDVKNISPTEAHDYLSTDNHTFRGALGDYLRVKFPNPSIYES